MVEINFIEKKKYNLVPYLTGAFFILLLVLSGLLLNWQHTNQQQELQSIQQQLNDNLTEQQELTSLQGIQEQRVTLKEQINHLQTAIYPTVPLLDRMIALLPENGYFTNYSFSINEGLTIDIRVNEIEQIAGYTHALEIQNFVDNVTLSTVQMETTENTTYFASFQLQINEQAWRQEANQ
ncbi:hypothetical protein [Aquibacillus saliphilus]|uniref:hypothetical protein n=1 Tax=Aquibacillus saliphilus TaxID=1909422 RepID=UPI001CEFC563|nr:hypothetical protein [Aquibacillus saliphilus]